MGLDTVELVMEIETKFDIRVDDTIWAKTETVEEILEVVWEHCDKQIYMDKNLVAEQLKALIIDCLGISEKNYGLDKSIVKDFGVD